MICFRFKGEPVGKGRPKITTRGKYAHAYTPKKTKEFEENIRFEFMASTSERMPVYPKDMPVKIEMEFGFEVPKSYSQKKRRACLLGQVQHTKKPDADNIAKAVCDALNGYAFEDDSQIVFMQLEKVYAEEPYVEVRIYPRDWSD